MQPGASRRSIAQGPFPCWLTYVSWETLVLGPLFRTNEETEAEDDQVKCPQLGTDGMNPEFRHSLLIVSEQMCIEKRGDRGREPSDKCIMATSQDIPTLYTNFLLVPCATSASVTLLSLKSQEIMTAFRLGQSAPWFSKCYLTYTFIKLDIITSIL